MFAERLTESMNDEGLLRDSERARFHFREARLHEISLGRKKEDAAPGEVGPSPHPRHSLPQLRVQMLLHHEVEGAANPVPPRVKHVIASSNLPAPECAKLQERTPTPHVLANAGSGAAHPCSPHFGTGAEHGRALTLRDAGCEAWAW